MCRQLGRENAGHTTQVKTQMSFCSSTELLLLPKGVLCQGKRNGSNAKVISHSSLSNLSEIDLALLGAGRGREINFLKPFF